MNIGILISGRGSNMVAIVDAVASGEIPASHVRVVISDQASAAGIQKAKERGVDTLLIERKGRKREDHDGEILAQLQKRDVELVCLAGYMRLLSPKFVEQFRGRIVNIHPSLLPSFKGLDAQAQALAAGVETSGCTVHYVDEHLDNGDVILQRTVPVLPGDTVETLSARILAQEHTAYVAAVRQIAAEGFADKR